MSRESGSAAFAGEDRPAVREALQRAVESLLAGRRGLRALEAGAGKRTRLRLPDDAYVVGVDTDAAAIARNARLNERIVADLATYAPPPASFDLVTCWYVLEHARDPAALLDRLAGWTAPGGLVVLAVPNLRSPKALATKLTPHRLHVWFRRRVFGFPHAGTPGFGPYPTTLRGAIAPHALVRRFTGYGFRPAFQLYFEDAKQASLRRRVRLTGGRWRLVRTLTRVLSLGTLDAERTEYAAVFRRLPEAQRDRRGAASVTTAR